MLFQKHHYHELTIEMQNILGTIPNQFTKYWIQRFPKLVSHSYHALEQCSRENTFKSYYSKVYTFAKPSYFFEPCEDFIPMELPPKPHRDSPAKKSFYKDSTNLKNQLDQRKSFAIAGNGDISNIVAKSSRKGGYNFHRNNDTDNTNNGSFILRQNILKKRKETTENVRWDLSTE